MCSASSIALNIAITASVHVNTSMSYYSSEEPKSVDDRHIFAGEFYFLLKFRHGESIIGIALDLDAACGDDDESLIRTINNAKRNQRNVATVWLDELFLFLIVQSTSVGHRGQTF